MRVWLCQLLGIFRATQGRCSCVYNFCGLIFIWWKWLGNSHTQLLLLKCKSQILLHVYLWVVPSLFQQIKMSNTSVSNVLPGSVYHYHRQNVGMYINHESRYLPSLSLLIPEALEHPHFHNTRETLGRYLCFQQHYVSCSGSESKMSSIKLKQTNLLVVLRVSRVGTKMCT